MKELESEKVEYESVEEFLTSLKKEFGKGEEELVKAVELRKLEQREKMMEEFVQEFKRAARGSGYEGRLLVEEFKREMNGAIRRKLMESENQLGSIEQWYRKATALDRNWRESRRLVWQRRQMPSQQVTMKPAPMEGVERINVVVVRGLGQGVETPPRWDPYAIEINQERNCYACGGFGHMACHYRNRGRGRPMEGRRVEYSGGRIEEIFNNSNNLKGRENLELLN